jgi:hypothetical protein
MIGAILIRLVNVRWLDIIGVGQIRLLADSGNAHDHAIDPSGILQGINDRRNSFDGPEVQDGPSLSVCLRRPRAETPRIIGLFDGFRTLGAAQPRAGDRKNKESWIKT